MNSPNTPRRRWTVSSFDVTAAPSPENPPSTSSPAPQDHVTITSPPMPTPASAPLSIFCCNTLKPIQLVNNNPQATSQISKFLTWAKDKAETEAKAKSAEEHFPSPNPHIIQVHCVDPLNDPGDIYGKYQGSGQWFGIAKSASGPINETQNADAGATLTHEYTEICPSENLLQRFKQTAVLGLSCTCAEHGGMWYEVSVLVYDGDSEGGNGGIFSVSPDDDDEFGDEASSDNGDEGIDSIDKREFTTDSKQDSEVGSGGDKKKGDTLKVTEDTGSKGKRNDSQRKSKHEKRRGTEEQRKRDNERRKEQRKKARVAKKGDFLAEEDVVEDQEDIEHSAGAGSGTTWGAWMCAVM